MSVLTVRTAILGKLNAMGTLKAAFDFPTGNPSGKYPHAVLTIRDGDGEFKSTRHNERRYGFWIRVYQEMSKEGQGVEAAEDITVDVLDEILKAFDMDTTLSGNCKYVNPVNWNCTHENRELDMRVIEMQLDAVDIVNSI